MDPRHDAGPGRDSPVCPPRHLAVGQARAAPGVQLSVRVHAGHAGARSE